MKINGVLDPPDDQQGTSRGSVCDACNGKRETANSRCVERWNGSIPQHNCVRSVTAESRPFHSFRRVEQEAGVVNCCHGCWDSSRVWQFHHRGLGGRKLGNRAQPV
jgi:hypothetical protein